MDQKLDNTWHNNFHQENSHDKHKRPFDIMEQNTQQMVSVIMIMGEHDLSHITPTSPAEPIHPRCWAHDVWSIMSSCHAGITIITTYMSHITTSQLDLQGTHTLPPYAPHSTKQKTHTTTWGWVYYIYLILSYSHTNDILSDEFEGFDAMVPSRDDFVARFHLWIFSLGRDDGKTHFLRRVFVLASIDAKFLATRTDHNFSL